MLIIALGSIAFVAALIAAAKIRPTTLYTLFILLALSFILYVIGSTQ